MNWVLTAEEMRHIDYESVIKLRISEKQLMELAGNESCNILLNKLGDLANKTALVICGKGNNGGDGIVLTRHLINHGAYVDLAYLCKTELLKQDGAASLKILTQYISYTNSFRIFEADDSLPKAILNKKYDIIIDAILGTGYKRTDHPKGLKRHEANNQFLPYLSPDKLSEPEKPTFELSNELRPSLSPIITEAIALINYKKVHDGSFVVAIDSPTGLDSTTGDTESACVHADLTIALAFLKTGFFFGKGPSTCGEIHIADISIPKFLVNQNSLKLVDKTFVNGSIPKREKSSAKHLNGKVLVVAGSQSEDQSMMGALILSLQGALKSGAGYVCASIPKTSFNLIHSLFPEAILIAQSEPLILERVAWADSILIGCGLGRSPEKQGFMARLLMSPLLSQKKLVIDADALYTIAELDLLTQLNLKNAILTPHIAEFSRLVQKPISEIESDRLGFVKSFVEKFKLGLLLKGSPTLIGYGNQFYLNTTGTEALATAGTGDVLAGMITSFAAQGADLLTASSISTYLHGIAGQKASEKIKKPCASDILHFI